MPRMSSMSGDDDGDLVLLRCTDPHRTKPDDTHDEEIVLSTAEVNTWDLPSILNHQSVKVKANRNRLIEESSYFRGLLSGSFSESCHQWISIQWDLEIFISLLKFMFGCLVDMSSDNFLPLFEGALFFGIEKLLLRCKLWLTDITLLDWCWPLQLDDLIHVWNFGLENANDFIPELCVSYLAKNFMWAISSNSFDDLPYDLLLSCLKHPYLTIDSEKSLSDALLNWLAASEERKSNWTDMLKQIRISLLPLWFAAGKRSCSYFSKFADESINAILALVNHPFTGSVNSLGDDDLSHLRLRLTKYTKRVDVSGCPQITPVIMLLSILPCSYSSYQILKKKLKQYSMSRERLAGDNFQISWGLWPALTFEAVQELDITNCPMLNLEAAIECFCKSFPSLRVLKAAYFLNFRVTKLQQLVGRLPLLCDVDLTVDISPVRPTKMSILSSLPVTAPRISASSLGIDSCPSVATLSCISRPLLSNLTRLTLEGRTDVGDFELKKVTELCVSLCYLNLKGCTSMTDAGIADLILRCVKLHSIVICDTSFGQHSVMALCSSKPNFDHSAAPQINEDSHSLAYKLQTLHIGGCTGVNEDSLTQLLSQVHLLKSLCLRETQLVDNGLYNFLGFSLEMLDVSNTKVSTAALAHVAERNAGLKCLKARGCRNFLKQDKTEGEASTSPHASKELYLALRRSCKLEEVAIGWGSSCFSIETLKPAITMLRAITVGLGGSLGQDGLKLLAASCPLLESVILYFQVISDAILMDMLKSFIHLQVLALCYCLGEISSLCFQVNMPFLRKLRLERVTPWMTNDDLVILTQSAANLVELTLLGCSLLNSESQEIISYGWPGLISILLEDCGKVTTNGVTSLLQCQALEDILLRHNACHYVWSTGLILGLARGKIKVEVLLILETSCIDDIRAKLEKGSGLQRDFILDAASKLPMLRKVSLDVCDAKDGDFDIPNVLPKYCENSKMQASKVHF